MYETKNEIPIEKVVARNIRLIRKSQKISQECLAEALGVSWQQISNYETGKSKISLDKLERISQFLDVPINQFLLSSDVSKKNKKYFISHVDDNHKAMKAQKFF